MPNSRYYVVQHDGAWKIAFRGRHYGPYGDETTAFHAAVEAASKASAKAAAQVLVAIAEHKFRVAWTHGVDPYPLADAPRAEPAAAPTLVVTADEIAATFLGGGETEFAPA